MSDQHTLPIVTGELPTYTLPIVTVERPAYTLPIVTGQLLADFNYTDANIELFGTLINTQAPVRDVCVCVWGGGVLIVKYTIIVILQKGDSHFGISY